MEQSVNERENRNFEVANEQKYPLLRKNYCLMKNNEQ